MIGNTVVTMNPDGSAHVHTGSDGQIWPKEEVERAEGYSRSCCESRKAFWPEGAINCVCLACCVTTAARKAAQ